MCGFHIRAGEFRRVLASSSLSCHLQDTLFLQGILGKLKDKLSNNFAFVFKSLIFVKYKMEDNDDYLF